MDVDADQLADALADRLAAIVPDGFHVRAADGMLWYSSDAGRFPGQMSNFHVGISGTYIRDNLEAHDDTAEGAASVVAQALDALQDYVDEASHNPWPGTRTPPRSFARIRLWYGGPEINSPDALACEPIPLARFNGCPSRIAAR